MPSAKYLIPSILVFSVLVLITVILLVVIPSNKDPYVYRKIIDFNGWNRMPVSMSVIDKGLNQQLQSLQDADIVVGDDHGSLMFINSDRATIQYNIFPPLFQGKQVKILKHSRYGIFASTQQIAVVLDPVSFAPLIQIQCEQREGFVYLAHRYIPQRSIFLTAVSEFYTIKLYENSTMIMKIKVQFICKSMDFSHDGSQFMYISNQTCTIVNVKDRQPKIQFQFPGGEVGMIVAKPPGRIDVGNSWVITDKRGNLFIWNQGTFFSQTTQALISTQPLKFTQSGSTTYLMVYSSQAKTIFFYQALSLSFAWPISFQLPSIYSLDQISDIGSQLALLCYYSVEIYDVNNGNQSWKLIVIIVGSSVFFSCLVFAFVVWWRRRAQLIKQKNDVDQYSLIYKDNNNASSEPYFQHYDNPTTKSGTPYAKNNGKIEEIEQKREEISDQYLARLGKNRDSYN